MTFFAEMLGGEKKLIETESGSGGVRNGVSSKKEIR
jgi:hypothetical protein